MINDYSKATFANLPAPDRWIYVATGETGEEQCVDAEGNSSYTDQSYEYCPSDETVYVGERSMLTYSSRMGDAAPAVGLAHEWGHHVQKVAGVVIRRDHQQIDTIAQDLMVNIQGMGPTEPTARSTSASTPSCSAIKAASPTATPSSHRGWSRMRSGPHAVGCHRHTGVIAVLHPLDHCTNGKFKLLSLRAGG